jgi:DNA ligase D-like protein (predicted 3'-phosphoesterase)
MENKDERKLKEYRKKRDFTKTNEPSGNSNNKGKMPRFVIQKHDATNLHYDLRLEMDEILKSWTIPKGPSTDPSEKRLAILTENHPLDYIDFEGTIPEDEYGGGTVIVWDGGTYRNLRKDKEGNGLSMAESFDDGKVEVWLEGKKLRGGYVLLRIEEKESDKWLFIKMRDDEADARRNPVNTESRSILSDKTIEEIKKEL